MQNKFGLKDLILYVLVAAIIGSLWLKMLQQDRMWDQSREAQNEMKTISQQMARLQQSIDSQSRTIGGLGRVSDATSGGARENAGSAASGKRDSTWARSGAPEKWSREQLITTDPASKPNFSPGGEMVLVFEGQPAILTPLRYGDTYGRYVNEEVVESLGRINPATLELEHVLAEAYQMDPEGNWFRAKIREAARFSDGKPVTAEDVRYTFHEMLGNPEIQADRFRAVYNGIAEVKVIGERVVEFTFKEPRFDNRQQALLMPVLPKHFYSRFTASQINQSTGLLLGSGPYKFASVDPASQWTPPADIVLVRNEGYWGPRPALDVLRYKVVQDATARLTTFTNGKADFIRPTAAQYAAKREDPEFLATSKALDWFNMQGGWSFICWQNGPRAGGKTTPFSERNVRLAMTHLIDRERIRRDIFKNLARPATGPFNSETPQANPAIKPWPYDMERAKALLEEADWKDRDGDGVRENAKGERFTFQLTYPSGNESTLQMVTYVKDQCAKVGIICELTPIDWSVLQSVLDRRDFDAITFAWSASAPEADPTQLWSIKSIDGTGDNFAQWRSEAADALIAKGRRIIDDEARMKVWHELHALWHSEQPYTPLVEQPWLRFVSKKVENVNTYKYGLKVSEFFIPLGSQKSQ